VRHTSFEVVIFSHGSASLRIRRCRRLIPVAPSRQRSRPYLPCHSPSMPSFRHMVKIPCGPLWHKSCLDPTCASLARRSSILRHCAAFRAPCGASLSPGQMRKRPMADILLKIRSHHSCIRVAASIRLALSTPACILGCSSDTAFGTAGRQGIAMFTPGPGWIKDGPQRCTGCGCTRMRGSPRGQFPVPRPFTGSIPRNALPRSMSSPSGPWRVKYHVHSI
jgi:hypothetical protein